MERVRVEGAPTRCPFCHESCSADEALVCRDCLARHHSECWGESGSCGSCGSEVALGAGQLERPALTDERARELLVAAGHTRGEIEALLKQRTAASKASAARTSATRTGAVTTSAAERARQAFTVFLLVAGAALTAAVSQVDLDSTSTGLVACGALVVPLTTVLLAGVTRQYRWAYVTPVLLLLSALLSLATHERVPFSWTYVETVLATVGGLGSVIGVPLGNLSAFLSRRAYGPPEGAVSVPAGEPSSDPKSA